MASDRERGPGEPGPAPLPGSPPFADRTEAGVLLGAAVRDAVDRWEGTERGRGPAGRPAAPRDQAGPGGRVRVFALPRGGVPVAAGVARALGAPLDVLVVRKIGHPATPELGLGAIAEDGRGGVLAPYFDQGLLREVGLVPADLAEVVTRERAELARRVAVYRRVGEEAEPRPRSVSAGGATGDAAAADPGLAGRLAIVVDDGLATGVTARAALRALRARGPAGTMLAVPVAAAAAVAAMQNETGEVVTVVTPRRFVSVGEWYADFGQLTDADVLTLLAAIP